MQRKITLGSIYVPGWGGPATEGYRLFELMQQQGMNVSFVNIIPDFLLEFFQQKFGDPPGNPQQLANVHNCIVEGRLTSDSMPFHLVRLLDQLSPDVIVGKMWRAAFLLKRAAPQIPLIFLPSGSERLKMYIRRRMVKDFLSLPDFHDTAAETTDASLIEQETVRCSDLVVVHSEIMHSLYKKFYPFLNGKLHEEVLWYSEWILQEASQYSRYKFPFEQRDIDILFIANDWSRPEKNFELLKKIAFKYSDLSIHVAGELEEQLPGVNKHGLITNREEIFSLMGRAKTVVSPSVFDAAPNILFEASAMDCNIVCSKNCGNWRLCNEKLLVDPFTPDNFIRKIRLALTGKFRDNLALFVGKNSYQKLKDLILSY